MNSRLASAEAEAGLGPRPGIPFLGRPRPASSPASLANPRPTSHQPHFRLSDSRVEFLASPLRHSPH
eukprot:235534-Prymnesium_polylepis.1